jgi:hypothetical protein
MALASASGFGQNRSSVGTIRAAVPAAGAPIDIPTGRSAAQRRETVIGKAADRKAQAKQPAKRKNALGELPKVPAKPKLQAKAGKAEYRQPPMPAPVHAGEQCWQQIQEALQPARLVRLAEECERDFPASPYGERIRDIAATARKALDIQRSTGLSGDFFEDSTGDAAYRENLGKAVRGDKDAAYLIALAYRLGTSGVAASSRRMEQWLRFSAELGSGLASWELAEFYNYGGLMADAARYEKRALELGYRPPFRLPTRGY